MRTVILFYSYTGNNRLLAETLAARLGCPAIDVHEQRRRTPLRLLLDLAFRRFPKIAPLSLPAHDHLLVITPLWNRWIAHPMRTALRALARGTDGIGHYAIVTFSGGERPGQVDFVDDQLLRLTGRSPDAHWALYVEGLVPEEIRGTPKVSQYRVTAEDLATFPDLDEIAGWAEGRADHAA